MEKGGGGQAFSSFGPNGGREGGREALREPCRKTAAVQAEAGPGAPHLSGFRKAAVAPRRASTQPRSARSRGPFYVPPTGWFSSHLPLSPHLPGRTAARRKSSGTKRPSPGPSTQTSYYSESLVSESYLGGSRGLAALDDALDGGTYWGEPALPWRPSPQALGASQSFWGGRFLSCFYGVFLGGG